ncbi:MAG: L,D-transpeptidase, partial [Actinomycetota bacterium]|nr:L,D-transpeptidase [Actinomycetota bacterium]
PKPAVLSYSASPGGPAVGQIPATRWGTATLRPVVQRAPGGWVALRLDTRPNGSIGWVRQRDVNLTTTPYRIVISISRRTLTFYQYGLPTYSAPVGVGKAQTATPIGPSFVNAVVAVPPKLQYIYGPVVLLTASHSNVFTEFDGGDGTVGIHGYPSDPASTSGVASSHGCVRASPATMATIGHVPVGTPVDIIA